MAGPEATTVDTTVASPLGEARGALGRQAAMEPALEAAIFGANQKQQAAGLAQSAAITSGAVNLAESTRLDAEQQINIDSVHRQLLSAVGLDINDPKSALSQELQTEATARQKRAEMRPKITELQSTSLFSDPISYLMAIPQLNALVPQYNALADTENEAGSEIARMTALATSLKSLTPARSADLLRQKAQVDANKIKDDAAAQAAQISAANAAGNAKAMLDAYTARHNMFASVLSLSQHEESIKMRQLSIKQLQMQRDITNEARAERLKAKTDADNQETALTVGINLYRKAISGNVNADFTKEDIKRLPANIREAWYEVIMRGNYGNSYADSVPFIDRFGNVAAAAQTGNATMMQQVRTVKQRAEEMVPKIINDSNAKNPMSRMKADQALQLAYEQLYKEDQTLAAPGSIKDTMPLNSPYAVNFDGAMRAAKQVKTPGLVGSILLDAQARNPAQPLNTSMTPRNFLNEVTARVTAGTVDPKTAATETAQFFALSTATQYDASGLKYLGLPQLTDFTIRPGVAGEKTVDLMNPTKLEGYFTAQVAADRRAKQSVVGNRILFN